MWPIVSNSPDRAAAATSSKAGATMSASERPATQRGDVPLAVRRFDAVVHRADGEVVGVAGQVVADVGFPFPVVGQLDPEPDADALRCPALGGVADDPFAVGERRVAEGRGARLEVDVVGDRDLGDPALDGGRRVGVDRDAAVGREVRVQVGVERQVACLAIGLRRQRGPLIAVPHESIERQACEAIPGGQAPDGPDSASSGQPLEPTRCLDATSGRAVADAGANHPEMRPSS